MDQMTEIIRVLFPGKQKVIQNTSFILCIWILIATNNILNEKGNTADTFIPFYTNSKSRLPVLNFSFKTAL